MINTNAQTEKPATGNTGDGDKPQTPTILDEVRAERKGLAEDLEKLRAEKAELIRLRSNEIMGGGTDSGQAPQKPKELTPREYKDAVMKGLIKGN